LSEVGKRILFEERSKNSLLIKQIDQDVKPSWHEESPLENEIMIPQELEDPRSYTVPIYKSSMEDVHTLLSEDLDTLFRMNYNIKSNFNSDKPCDFEIEKPGIDGKLKLQWKEGEHKIVIVDTTTYFSKTRYLVKKELEKSNEGLTLLGLVRLWKTAFKLNQI